MTFPNKVNVSLISGRRYRCFIIVLLISRYSIQKHKPPSGFFANRTGAANGEEDRRMNPVDMFSSNNSITTTNSGVGIHYKGPQFGESPSCWRTCWSRPGRCSGKQSAHTGLNNRRNSWYGSGTISSKGRYLKSIVTISWLTSYSEALNTVSLPFFTVEEKGDPCSVTIFPQNSRWGRICGSNISLTGYTGSGSYSVTLCTITGASWQHVVQYWEPIVTVLDANRTATSFTCSEESARRIG